MAGILSLKKEKKMMQMMDFIGYYLVVSDFYNEGKLERWK